MLLPVFHSHRTVCLFVLGADELFAAPSWDFDPPRFGTGLFGHSELAWAQRDASDCTVHASALVFAVWTKDFPILVNLVVVLTCSTIRFGCFRESEVRFEIMKTQVMCVKADYG